MAIVIAELCQNHNGDHKLLEEMVWAAANSGADYAKIQTIFAKDLTFRERFEKGLVENGETKVICRPYKPEYERLSNLEIPFTEYEWFVDLCNKTGIKPLTTVFSRNRVKEVAKYGWRNVKVASYDCASFPLLRELSENFDHLFISTGATLDHEIEQTTKVLEGVSYSLLHAVTIYPTPLNQLNLTRMDYLRQFTPSVGFSDHTLVIRDGIQATAVALHLGANVIERHFTILEADKTKDGPVSVNPNEMSEICKLAHSKPEICANYIDQHVGDFTQMLGNRQRELSQVELLNRDYYRGRFASHLANGSIVYNWEDIPIE